VDNLYNLEMLLRDRQQTRQAEADRWRRASAAQRPAVTLRERAALGLLALAARLAPVDQPPVAVYQLSAGRLTTTRLRD
jgi:hypothetical protein